MAKFVSVPTSDAAPRLTDLPNCRAGDGPMMSKFVQAPGAPAENGFDPEIMVTLAEMGALETALLAIGVLFLLSFLLSRRRSRRNDGWGGTGGDGGWGDGGGDGGGGGD